MSQEKTSTPTAAQWCLQEKELGAQEGEQSSGQPTKPQVCTSPWVTDTTIRKVKIPPHYSGKHLRCSDQPLKAFTPTPYNIGINKRNNDTLGILRFYSVDGQLIKWSGEVQERCSLIQPLWIFDCISTKVCDCVSGRRDTRPPTAAARRRRERGEGEGV